MELTAVIQALRLLKRPCRVKIITDSNYVVKGMTEWMSGWLKRNWMNSQKKPVSNQDLWQMLRELSQPHQIQWHWIKGHGGHPENERCDQLAREAAETCKKRPSTEW
jgi:ribonuclease HI